jgi:hypothetical protein
MSTATQPIYKFHPEENTKARASADLCVGRLTGKIAPYFPRPVIPSYLLVMVPVAAAM